MPVRSLNSSVFKWPDAQTVRRAITRWAAEMGASREQVLRIGYFGSYARGDWGVGSDLDVLVLVKRSHLAFSQRPIEWDTCSLPVPTDIRVYTQREWADMASQSRRFYREAMRETVWVYSRESSEG